MMKEEIIFTAIHSILLIAFGLVWLWFSAERKESRKRRYAYGSAALVDLVLAIFAISAIASSRGLTFWSENTWMGVSVNALFSLIVRKKDAE